MLVSDGPQQQKRSLLCFQFLQNVFHLIFLHLIALVVSQSKILK